VTVLGAIRIPELAAAVCFYGLPPGNVASPADIRVPLQGHFANDDDWCTPDTVNAFEAALKTAGKQAEIYRYDAKHGFMNEQRPDAHQRQAAEAAWARSLDFWKKHL
jgi:carboxymethylenebutenolidase